METHLTVHSIDSIAVQDRSTSLNKCQAYLYQLSLGVVVQANPHAVAGLPTHNMGKSLIGLVDDTMLRTADAYGAFKTRKLL